MLPSFSICISRQEGFGTSISYRLLIALIFGIVLYVKKNVDNNFCHTLYYSRVLQYFSFPQLSHLLVQPCKNCQKVYSY